MKVLALDAGDGARVEADARALRRFLDEAQITAQLDHPSIVPVHDCGVDDEGRLYFTMPLVRGSSFADVIDDELGRCGRVSAASEAVAEPSAAA